MDADDEAFIRAMRRIADNKDGNKDVHIPRTVFTKMVDLAERGLPKDGS